ncbi:hypothetical protein CPter291_0802 [Collimonas pratensis]|uniref:Uncharacterized protein n=1 Tax=Collimonas pratensis TaxID=279113 RepID=A0A127QSY3_9BURK|nr:hypothetical protein CPter91_0885 [Collimonas pratensis]AMP13081.1 hypothetical protein CPter291_0802 [Collimonas pratensis]
MSLRGSLLLAWLMQPMPCGDVLWHCAARLFFYSGLYI